MIRKKSQTAMVDNITGNNNINHCSKLVAVIHLWFYLPIQSTPIITKIVGSITAQLFFSWFIPLFTTERHDITEIMLGMSQIQTLDRL